MLMNRDDALIRLQEILRDVFDDDALGITHGTVREDLPAWDSLGHIRLVSALEDAFGVTFTIEEIEGMTGIGRIVDTVLAKV